MEILAAGTRAVVVPFAEAGETEQTGRARRLAERGLIGLVEASILTPAALASSIDAADARKPGENPPIDLDGARKTAAFLRQTMEQAR